MTACCKPHKKLHKILRKKFNLESKVPSREEKFFTKTQRILRTARFARFYNACPKITLKNDGVSQDSYLTQQMFFRLKLNAPVRGGYMGSIAALDF